MISPWRNAAATLVLLMYVFTGPFVEAVHHDPAEVCAGGHAELTSHTCGEKERHIPLDHIHACVICARNADRSIAPSLAFHPSLLSPVSVVHILICTTQVVAPDLFSSGMRGPPRADV